MTDQTPVERAASYIITKPREGARTYREYAQDVYEAIDTNQLTAIILRTELPGGIKVGHAEKIALAVKNWLTGKDNQQ